MAVNATEDRSSMGDPRIIKKYPNRRLYDTALSSYITLDDVKKLVFEGQRFRVVHARTGIDLTRTILLQIISEQEERGAPIFSTEILEQIIRFYGDTLQGLISTYLDRSLRLFVEQQHALRGQMRTLMAASPLSMVTNLAERNLAIWKSMQHGPAAQEAPVPAQPDQTAKSPAATSSEQPEDRPAPDTRQ